MTADDTVHDAAQTSDEFDSRLSDLIESKTEAVSDPFPLYRDLLAAGPVHHWGPTYVVSSYEAVKAIGKDAVTYSNRGYSVGSRAESIKSGLSPEAAHAFEEVSAFESMYISRADGEQHKRLRNIAQRAFRPKKMALLKETTQKFTDQLIDHMIASGETDFVKGLSSRLPMIMINSLLDVPLEDANLIRGWSARIGKNRGGAVVADLLDAHAALAEFRDYVTGIVERHHADSGHQTDLVSALQGASQEDRLTPDELLATMVVLLFGGSDTTTALLGNGLYYLLEHRDQWELLCSDPDRYVGGAVEELTRYVTPVQTTWRVTTATTRLAGVDIPAGNTVLVLIAAANRDPGQFSDPDVLDITRSPNDHIAYFFGAHFCIGAALARLEAQTVFRTLARRFPELRLAQPETLARWGGNIQFRTISSLPLDWCYVAGR